MDYNPLIITSGHCVWQNQNKMLCNLQTKVIAYYRNPDASLQFIRNPVWNKSKVIWNGRRQWRNDTESKSAELQYFMFSDDIYSVKFFSRKWQKWGSVDSHIPVIRKKR